MEMKQRIKEFLGNILKNEDHEATWFLDLATVNGKRWALVAAWMDYDEDGNYEPYAKIAYQPTNSLMQEYDIDWMMPADEEGNVFDTEVIVKLDNLSVGEWLGLWETIKEEYVYIKGTNILFSPDPGGFADETQFDTRDRKELAELWFDFCLENNLIALEEVNIYD